MSLQAHAHEDSLSLSLLFFFFRFLSVYTYIYTYISISSLFFLSLFSSFPSLPLDRLHVAVCFCVLFIADKSLAVSQAPGTGDPSSGPTILVRCFPSVHKSQTEVRITFPVSCLSKSHQEKPKRWLYSGSAQCYHSVSYDHALFIQLVLFSSLLSVLKFNQGCHHLTPNCVSGRAPAKQPNKTRNWAFGRDSGLHFVNWSVACDQDYRNSNCIAKHSLFSCTAYLGRRSKIALPAFGKSLGHNEWEFPSVLCFHSYIKTSWTCWFLFWNQAGNSQPDLFHLCNLAIAFRWFQPLVQHDLQQVSPHSPYASHHLDATFWLAVCASCCARSISMV